MDRELEVLKLKKRMQRKRKIKGCINAVLQFLYDNKKWLISIALPIFIIAYLDKGYFLASLIGFPMSDASIETHLKTCQEDTKVTYNYKAELTQTHQFDNMYQSDYTGKLTLLCEVQEGIYDITIENMHLDIPDGRYQIFIREQEGSTILYSILSTIDGVETHTPAEENEELYGKLLKLVENPYQFLTLKTPSDGNFFSHGKRLFYKCRIKITEPTAYEHEFDGRYKNSYEYDLLCEPTGFMIPIIGLRDEIMPYYHSIEYKADSSNEDLIERIETTFTYETNPMKSYVIDNYENPDEDF